MHYRPCIIFADSRGKVNRQPTNATELRHTTLAPCRCAFRLLRPKSGNVQGGPPAVGSETLSEEAIRCVSTNLIGLGRTVFGGLRGLFRRSFAAMLALFVSTCVTSFGPGSESARFANFLLCPKVFGVPKSFSAPPHSRPRLRQVHRSGATLWIRP